jgi:hypothetical protein
MRTVLTFLFLILTAFILHAQVNKTMVSGVCSDTLKSSKKVINITPDININSRFTITLKTVSGTDTVYCTTNSRDNVYTTAKMLIDLSTGAPVTSMIATTTAKEYLVYDPMVIKLTLTTINGLVSTLFTVSRK